MYGESTVFTNLHKNFHFHYFHCTLNSSEIAFPSYALCEIRKYLFAKSLLSPYQMSRLAYHRISVVSSMQIVAINFVLIFGPNFNLFFIFTWNLTTTSYFPGAMSSWFYLVIILALPHLLYSRKINRNCYSTNLYGIDTQKRSKSLNYSSLKQ